MEAFLAYCKKNEIKVIGLEPPFVASVVKQLEERGKDYQYMADSPSRMSEVFEKIRMWCK